MSDAMRALRLALCAFVLGACGDDQPASDAGVDDAARPAEDGRTDDTALQRAFGTFGIELVAASDGASAYTDIVGRIYDARTPSVPQWRLVHRDGDCALLEPHNPFCDPACASGATCIDGNECVPAASSLDVGEVTLTGLRGEEGPVELMLSAQAGNFYQPRGASPLAYPPFAEGDAVVLQAAGGALAPFELRAEAIAPLEVLTEAPVPLGGEDATVLQWTPAASGASSRIIVRVDISHHGGQKGEIVCDTDDDGELELPASLVEGLIDLGVAGYPSLELERVAVNAPLAAAPGITLKIFASVTRAIEIPGVVSCTDENADEVCPEGETCLVTRLCGAMP